MALGYIIRLGDKTTCGGQVLGGDGDFTISGIPSARESDPVSCGVTGKTYQILGGVPSFTSDGLVVAGSLDSFSSCPCHARLIPSDFGFSYESSNSVLAPSGKQSSTTVSTSPANPAWAHQSFSRHHEAVIASAQARSSRAKATGTSLKPERIAVAGSQHDGLLEHLDRRLAPALGVGDLALAEHQFAAIGGPAGGTGGFPEIGVEKERFVAIQQHAVFLPF